MKSINVIILFILLSGCSGTSKFDSDLLAKRLQKKHKGLIISCIKCNCILEAFNENRDLLKDITIYGDSLCIPKQNFVQFSNLTQGTLDSVYEKNYNVILFKFGSNNNFKYKLIKTEETMKFKKIVFNFFSN